MRITGGNQGGRRIKVPKGLDVRPTPDLVKQAIFNSLGERVAGARTLEVFAGSGALSLEALSRGASSATLIEKSAKTAALLRRNFEAVQMSPGSYEVRVQDAFVGIAQLAAHGAKFDLILADPPYGEKNVNKRSESFAQRMLDDPHLSSLLAPQGLFILGHTKRDTLEIPILWEEIKTMKHGDTMMRFFRKRIAAAESGPLA